MFRNSDGTTQAIDVQNGNADIVMDLASDQLSSLRNADGLTIDETASPTIFFLFANADSSVSEVTSNPDFVEAVRYGLDYAGLLDLAGAGAVQAPGVIPDSFLGALSPDQVVVRDVDRAKEALARCDCADATVQLEYPSDLTANGLAFGPLAERIEANLDEVGIKVELVPGPTATTLENYRAGKEQMGLWLWNPDYPDPQDYLAFGPGQLVGLRAGWAEGGRPRHRGGRSAGSDDRRRRRAGPAVPTVPATAQRIGPVLPAVPAGGRGGVGDRPGHGRGVQSVAHARRPPARSRVIRAMSDDDRMRGHHRSSRSRRR